MRIAFIQNNALDESQALLELGAYLKGLGHPATVFLDRCERDLSASVSGFRPGLVIVAASMLNHSWAREVCARLRPLGIPILIGGTAPTLFPTALSRIDADFIVRGEAENPVREVVEALDDGAAPHEILNVAGLFQPHGAEFEGTAAAPGIDLDRIPAAHKDLYYDRYPFMRKFPFKRFLSSRGCHHRCTYCYIPSLNKVQPREKGQKWTRRKSPEQAVEEVAREKAMGPLSHVHFSDDLFTNDADWLDEFAPLYRRRVGVPFTCNTSAELITDGVAAALSEAGCYGIGFAVETASQQLRLKVLRKGVTEEHLMNAAAALHKHKVKLATFNMVALPGETPDECLDTAILNAKLGTSFARLNFAFPMPGTGMTEYAIKEGFLPQDWPAKFANPEFRYKPGPQFKTPYRTEFENLFVLFRLVSHNRSLAPAVRRAMSTKTPKSIYRLLTLQGAWNDKRTFRIPIVAGLRFFAKVGRPELRATNFPALI
ncbi:MAG: anaerobic magnesium-protoporphyrin IX monomethyl ester cyclase [Myxococcota bacterium]